MTRTSEIPVTPMHVTALQVLDACDALGIDYHGITSITMDAASRIVTVVRHVDRPVKEQHWPLSLTQTETYPIVESVA